jgi:GT2 family glycosyltransferase
MIGEQQHSDTILTAVLSFNHRDYLANCLRSLERLDVQGNRILVIDNGSTDGSLDVLSRQFPGIEVITNGQNIGVTAGFNIGFRYALQRGIPFVYLCNDDIICAPDVLASLLSTMHNDPTVGIAGSKVYTLEVPDRIWSVGGKASSLRLTTRHLHEGEVDDDRIRGVFDVDYVPACAVLVRMSMLEQIGLMNECLYLYWEDVDLCLRARKAGYRVVCVAHSKVWHRSSAGRQGTPFLLYYTMRNALVVSYTHTPWWQRWLVVCTGTERVMEKMFYFTLGGLLRRRSDTFHRVRAILQAYCDFMTGHLGRRV